MRVELAAITGVWAWLSLLGPGRDCSNQVATKRPPNRRHHRPPPAPAPPIVRCEASDRIHTSFLNRVFRNIMSSHRLFRFPKPQWINSANTRTAGVYAAGALVRSILSYISGPR